MRRLLQGSFLALVCLIVQMARAVTPEDQARLADGLYARGLYDMALREYEALLARPGAAPAPVWIYRVAESQRALGRTTEADRVYARLPAEFPGTEYAQRAALRLAEQALATETYGEVVRLLSRPPDAEVESSLRATWRYFLAHASKQSGQTREAEALYRRLLEQDPDVPYAALARLEWAELLTARDPASKEAERLLESVLAGGAGSPTAREAARRLAAQLYARGDYAGSARRYAQLFRDDPSVQEPLRTASAWAHFKAGLWNETLALVGSRQDADSLYLRANVLRQLKREGESRSTYRTLLEQHPQNRLAAPARYEAAVLALAAGDFAEAWTLSAEARPEPAWAGDLLWVRAEAAHGLGRREDALALYDQLIKEDPAGARVATAQFKAARLVQESGQWAEASRRYRLLARSVKEADLAAEAWMASAYAQSQLQKNEESVRDWTEVTTRYPAFARADEAWYGRARVAAESGQDDRARADLEQMLKKHPKSRWAPEAYLLLGTLLEKKEQWAAAEQQYRLAVQAKPDPALIRRIEFRRVAVLQRQNRPDDAAVALNGLLAGAEGAQGLPANLLDWLARWNLDHKKWKEAGLAAQALLAQGGVWSAIGGYQTGLAREGLGLTNEARAAYRDAAQAGAGRESLESAYRAGYLALQAGVVEEARALLNRAAEGSADESLSDIRARSYLALAHLSRREGKDDEALRTYLSVGLLYDDPALVPESLFHAAKLMEKLGRTTERDQTLQELRDRYPDSSYAR